MQLLISCPVDWQLHAERTTGFYWWRNQFLVANFWAGTICVYILPSTRPEEGNWRHVGRSAWAIDCCATGPGFDQIFVPCLLFGLQIVVPGLSGFYVCKRNQVIGNTQKKFFEENKFIGYRDTSSYRSIFFRTFFRLIVSVYIGESIYEI